MEMQICIIIQYYVFILFMHIHIMVFTLSSGKMSGGAIAGVVFGVLAVLALIAVALMVVYRRWPVWRLQATLSGRTSQDTAKFENVLYKEEQEASNVTFA